jgi:carboxymethylenebutenolidase
MCFDHDSRPPIEPISGAAIDSEALVLEAADGNRLRAFSARGGERGGAGIVIVHDARGLHPYYEELALRFAERGVHALALDFFGRTAGAEERDADFDFMAHLRQVTFAGQTADLNAGVAYLRGDEGGAPTAVFTIGFCAGGRLAFLSSTLGLGLAGAIGFYGWPVGPPRSGDSPAPADVADRMTAPLLGIFGEADENIGADAVAEFRAALEAAGVEHRIVTYPDAPHSFFDRRAEEFADASADAWSRVIEFVDDRGASRASNLI